MLGGRTKTDDTRTERDRDGTTTRRRPEGEGWGPFSGSQLMLIIVTLAIVLGFTTVASATTADRPGRPTRVVARPQSIEDRQYFEVSWTAPARSGGSAITSYVVRAFHGDSARAVRIWKFTKPREQHRPMARVTLPLHPNSARCDYHFTVAAQNADGAGAQSAPSNTVYLSCARHGL
jgi:hypothetical protein